MSLAAAVYVLTALAGLIIVLTRLGALRSRATAEQGRGSLRLHTVAGVLALAGWVAFLTGKVPQLELVGVISLFFWWLAVAAGLLLSTLSLPSRGRRAKRVRQSRFEGRMPVLLTHVGLLICVAVFTYAYTTAAV
ncbi:MAG: hypothetical protein WAW88_13750 [Nocardioides sp.]